MEKVEKIKNGIRVPPLFYQKQYQVIAFVISMCGLAGTACCMVKVLYGHQSREDIMLTSGDWLCLSISFFLWGTFMALSAVLQMSYTFMKILDTIIDDDTIEPVV